MKETLMQYHVQVRSMHQLSFFLYQEWGGRVREVEEYVER